MKRLPLAMLVCCLAFSACSLTPHRSSVYQADFSRAVQVFPGVKVRVLGVEVGQVTDIRNVSGAVQVTLRIDNSSVKIPADVQAAVVPMSLLGERYIQLFPAYQGGPTLRAGGTIPLARTAVPSEPDELLRSLQDYLGGIDPQTVTAFVENAAKVLQGTGGDLNQLIEHGAGVLSTLSAKRDDLAQLIVQLNTLTQALSTRQQAIGRLIRSYDVVAGTLNQNRTALEGTITGLNDAATQLASLLIAHRTPLGADIQALTRTAQSLNRNEGSLARTGHWATLLFEAASRATDYNHDWLRLNNQGEQIGALILLRLQQRLEEMCLELHAPKCTKPSFWKAHVPQLFCFDVVCPGGKGGAGAALSRAMLQVPQINQALSARARQQGGSVQDLVDQVLQQSVGNPGAFRWLQ